MPFRLKDTLRRARFARQCRAVWRSAPIELDPSSGIALLSQVQHKDLLMYLLAVKSFCKWIKPRAIFVLDDGSLEPDDRERLRRHIVGVTFLELPSFRSSACPTGGTWERLLAISSLIDDHYVIQLDSDTLVVGPIEEVNDSVRQQRAFVLGTWDHQQFETMGERWETARKLSRGSVSHIQLVAEANFDKLREFASLRYVRGCSGFAGFSRRSFTRSFVDGISTQMREALGDRWAEWGSEQVMSNIVVANIENSMVLPHPKYTDCHKVKEGETEFIHFIGSCRFDGGAYAARGREVIDSL